jgi:glycosyltransferase involved in cell wall biosynthesis
MSVRSQVVSVIIPVYNAERYVEQSARSALDQPETLEVVLVEDGSPDNAVQVCRRLTEEFEPRVRLFRHPGGRSRGEACSRNLGIRQARGKYVAFLDADDYFLTDRFSVSVPILDSDPTVDGVYEAVGVTFESESALREWRFRCRGSDLTTVTARIPPERLLEALVRGGHGYFCMGGIILRSSVFDKVGLFDESLPVCPDTPMWWQIAAVCRLVPGRTEEAVAIRRRHDANLYSMNHPHFHKARFSGGLSAYRWARTRRLPERKLRFFREALTGAIVDHHRGVFGRVRLRAMQASRWIHASLRFPEMLLAPEMLRKAVGLLGRRGEPPLRADEPKTQGTAR